MSYLQQLPWRQILSKLAFCLYMYRCMLHLHTNYSFVVVLTCAYMIDAVPNGLCYLDFIAPVWKVARYMCVQQPCICEVDNYVGTESIRANLTSIGLRRVRKFYSEKHQSSARVSSVVRLSPGQFGTDLPCTSVCSL